jgi:hypothetical protein
LQAQARSCGLILEIFPKFAVKENVLIWIIDHKAGLRDSLVVADLTAFADVAVWLAKEHHWAEYSDLEEDFIHIFGISVALSFAGELSVFQAVLLEFLLQLIADLESIQTVLVGQFDYCFASAILQRTDYKNL